MLKTVLDERLKDLLKDAARAFVIAAAGKVPVYTGMAKSSLKPLAAFLNADLNITPVHPPIQRRGYLQGPAAGEARGYKDFGSKILQEYWFIFKTEVLHYIINEFNTATGKLSKNLKQPTPWLSLVEGAQAFYKVIALDGKLITKDIKPYMELDRRVIK